MHLDGLIGFTDAAATFAVFSSQGDKTYTVTLADEKHKCACVRAPDGWMRHALAMLLAGLLPSPPSAAPAALPIYHRLPVTG